MLGQCEETQPFHIGPDTVHVYDVDLSSHFEDLERLRAVLDAHESARAVRFVTAKLQRDYVVSHGTTRIILSRYVGVAPEALTFVQGEHGKPSLVRRHGSGIHFNLSHSGDKCLLAVARDREVGVDVERIRPLADWFEIAKRFFSQRETERLSSLPESLRHDAFFATWSRKEAYIKALGFGLALELGSFAVEVDPREEARLVWARDHAQGPADWQMRNVAVDAGYHAAVAVRGPFELAAMQFCF